MCKSRRATRSDRSHRTPVRFGLKVDVSSIWSFMRTNSGRAWNYRRRTTSCGIPAIRTCLRRLWWPCRLIPPCSRTPTPRPETNNGHRQSGLQGVKKRKPAGYSIHSRLTRGYRSTLLQKETLSTLWREIPCALHSLCRSPNTVLSRIALAQTCGEPARSDHCTGSNV